jgi:hypothetical protein
LQLGTPLANLTCNAAASPVHEPLSDVRLAASPTCGLDVLGLHYYMACVVAVNPDKAGAAACSAADTPFAGDRIDLSADLSLNTRGRHLSCRLSN